LFTCALCEHLRPGPVGTLFILDEFRVAVGHLKIINNFWSLVRGFGVQFLVVCQSVVQLKVLFKDEYEIYAGQAGCVATLGAPGDMTSARFMSERAGTLMENRASSNEGQGVNTQGGPHLDAGSGKYLNPVFRPELLEAAAHQAADRSESLLRGACCACDACRVSRHGNRKISLVKYSKTAAQYNSSARGNGGAVRRGGVRCRQHWRGGVASCAAPCLASAAALAALAVERIVFVSIAGPARRRLGQCGHRADGR
jgi:hypothetical protein